MIIDNLNMSVKRMMLKVSKEDATVGYLYLPNHAGKGVSGVSKKQIHLHELIENYKGADVILDFNKDDELIGIEILG
jgi:Protein of unknown function (DUF2283)